MRALDDLKGKKRPELVEFLTELADKSYEDKERHFVEMLGEEGGLQEMRDLERRVTLQSLDRHWMEHLSSMDYLREGIGWRGYAGIDPLVLYKKEAYDMFQQMQASIQEEVVRVMSTIQISLDPQVPHGPAGRPPGNAGTGRGRRRHGRPRPRRSPGRPRLSERCQPRRAPPRYQRQIPHPALSRSIRH